MPNTIIDKDGNEVEVPTAEEIEAMKQEAAEAAAKEAADKAKAEADAELAKKEEELEALRSKDRDWRTLRNKADKKDTADEQHAKELEELRTRLSAMEKQPFETAKQTFLNSNASVLSDKDTKEKFDFFYSKLADGVKDSAAHDQALAAALIAATGGTAKPAGARVIATSSQIPITNDHSSQSEMSRAIAKDLGLSDEDIKKHSQPLENLW